VIDIHLLENPIEAFGGSLPLGAFFFQAAWLVLVRFDRST
jgi:hypothetical protein